MSFMTCCSVDKAEAKTDEHAVCNCGAQSKRVSRKTLLFMLKPQFLEAALNGTYRFCGARECPIVYFEEQGARIFTVDDLRIVVGVKRTTDPIPLCYCFGFDERHLREEILQAGTTTIPEKVSHLIREGLCACDVRNPSGKCCLGDVKKTADSLKQEFSM